MIPILNRAGTASKEIYLKNKRLLTKKIQSIIIILYSR
jgi:hypothetical protein